MANSEVFEQFEQQLIKDLQASLEEWEAPVHSVTLKDKSSMYRVSSALQKSIRRGRVEDAERYATAIYNSTESWYLWNRLPVIAFEDIGLADVWLVAETMAICRRVANREKIGPKKAMLWMVSQMANFWKSRVLCDLVCSVSYVKQAETDFWLKDHVEALDPQYRAMVEKCRADQDIPLQVYLQTLEQEMLATNGADFLRRAALYACYASAKREMYQMDRALFTFRHDLSTLAKMLPKKDEIVDQFEPEYLHNLPDYAYDQHTREGKSAILYWNKACEPVRNLNLKDPLKKLGIMVFQAEGALLNQWAPGELGELSRDQNNLLEVYAHGWTKDEIKQWVDTCDFKQEVKEALNKARLRILDGKPKAP